MNICNCLIRLAKILDFNTMVNLAFSKHDIQVVLAMSSNLNNIIIQS